jgi:two-component system sensor histidine kinase PilS (NtrC family)
MLIGWQVPDLETLLAAAEDPSEPARLLAAVYALSACWGGLVLLNRFHVAQSYAQILVDLFLITWTVHVSGGPDSYFSAMYFLEIVMAGILLPSRRAAFATAVFSSLLHSVHINFAWFGILSGEGMSFPPDGRSLQYLLAMRIFAYWAVGYLTDVLAAKWQASSVALQESTGRVAFLQAFTSHIIDSLGAGLITTDMDGRIYLFNPAATRLTGRSAEEAVGRPIGEMFESLPSDPESGAFERLLTRGGSEVWLHFSVTRLGGGPGALEGRVWVFDDVTGIRKMERDLRQQERMAAIGVMAAGIAHEIRNPLASIRGSFDMLRKGLELGPEEAQLAGIIGREADRLNQTINDFLMFARPSEPRRKPVYLEKLLSETIRLMQNSTALRDDQLIEADLDPASSRVDENMMRQVFYNLMSNALKAMPEGGTLRVVLRSTRDKVRIAFSDSGIGMTPAQVDSLFVPFSSSFRSGTGLGLSIVYQIVGSHDGTIQVETSEGEGSTFTVELPRYVAGEAGEAVGRPGWQEDAGPSGESVREALVRGIGET